MPGTPPLPNLLTNLGADLHDVAFLWHFAAAAASLLVAWLAGTVLRPRIASMENSPAVGRDMLAAIQLPLVAVLLILGIRAAMGGSGLTLLDLMVALLTAAIIIRLAVVMLRQVFSPSGWREVSILSSSRPKI